MSESLVLLSGGIDSAVLLACQVDFGQHPACYTFDYGQRHAREIEHARQIARHYDCRHDVITLPAAILAGSALTGRGDVPRGHYTDPSQLATIVPNRNAVLLSIAASRAGAAGIYRIMFAAHSGDAAIYPDCRPAFVDLIDRALHAACGVRVEAPFVAMDKREIVVIGRRLNVPLYLTWSCYEGADVPCGQCGACVERREAGA